LREEPVNRYTSQAWAMFCIQVPMREISWPLKKSWKLRWRSARKVTESLVVQNGGRPRPAVEILVELEALLLPTRSLLDAGCDLLASKVRLQLYR